MTLEEIIQNLTDIQTEAEEGVCYVTDHDSETLKAAIKSLEAWGGIKRDIEKIQRENSDNYGTELEVAKYDAYNDCLDIVQEHLTEIQKDNIERLYEINYTRHDGTSGGYKGTSKEAFDAEIKKCNQQGYDYNVKIVKSYDTREEIDYDR